MTTNHTRFLYTNFYQYFRFAFTAGNSTRRFDQDANVIRAFEGILKSDKFSRAEKNAAKNAYISFLVAHPHEGMK